MRNGSSSIAACLRGGVHMGAGKGSSALSPPMGTTNNIGWVGEPCDGLLSSTVRRALVVCAGEWKPPGSSHGVTIDSIYHYGKLVYQDVNLRDHSGSIRPPTRKTFGFRLGRCIIHHSPKRTFIHLSLPRRPRRLKQRGRSRGRPV